MGIGGVVGNAAGAIGWMLAGCKGCFNLLDDGINFIIY
jgi:hypothetical protein